MDDPAYNERMPLMTGAKLHLRYSDRVIPLTCSDRAVPVNAEDVEFVRRAPVHDLFPDVRAGAAARAGLLLLLGDWESAHEAAQDVSGWEGSWWHAILHRMEPDAVNARYWYRQVGNPPLYEQLHEMSSALLHVRPVLGWSAGKFWDALRFITWCEEARALPGSAQEATVLTIQRAEFDLLYGWCAQDLEQAPSMSTSLH